MTMPSINSYSNRNNNTTTGGSQTYTGGFQTSTNLDPYTYNPRYPGLDEENYRKLEAKIDALGLTGNDKQKAMDKAYPQILPMVQKEIENSDRRGYINQADYEVSQISDPEAKMSANLKLTATKLSQELKEKYNLDPTANDEEVFKSRIESIPNGGQLLANYINKGDKELLYAGGLRTKVKAPKTPESSVGGIQSIINKESEIEDKGFLGDANEVADWINLPGQATTYVDNLIQKIPVVTFDKQVENLANKMNNLSDEELDKLYNNYTRMIDNGIYNKRWETDDRNAWELFWDAITGDKDALDRLNAIHLYDYSEAMPQDGIERNSRGNKLWEKIGGADLDTVNKNIDKSNMPGIIKEGAKGTAWVADKTKNLLNFVGRSWGGLENYAEALGVGMQELKDMKNKNYYPEIVGELENNDEVFKAYVADRVANFGEYMTDAPDTLMGGPVSPNAAKFISNIPGSFLKTLSSKIRGKTNPLDSKIGLLKMLFTEEGQQAMIDRYGTVENIANTMNTDPGGLASDMIDWADKFNRALNKGSGGLVERRSIGDVTDALSDNAVEGINYGLTKTSDYLRDKGYNRTANLVDLERDVSTNPSMIKEDTKKITTQGVEDIKNAATATAETVKNLPENIKNAKDNAVEKVAKKLSGTKTGQDKLFQAQEPTLNRLSKERNTKNIRNKAEVANELIVKDIQKNGGELPTDTESRVNAHQRAMDNIWKEIESGIKDKKGYMISTKPIADALDEYIKKEESYGITSNQSDLNTLKEQSKALRDKGTIDVSTAEGLKQRINAKINDWDDKSVGNTAKNGLRILTQEIGSLEDSVIAKIPGEFQDLKNDFGALADGYGDVLKADVKAQRAKYSDSISNYSRIKGIADIFKGVWNGDLGEIGKGTAQALGGEVTAKLKDKDWLISEGFKELAEEMNKPNFKSSKKNKAGQPKYK